MANEIKLREIQTMLRGAACDIINLNDELKMASDERINAISNATRDLIKSIYEASGLDVDGDLL